MELLNVAEEASGNVDVSVWTGGRLREKICQKKQTWWEGLFLLHRGSFSKCQPVWKSIQPQALGDQEALLRLLRIIKNRNNILVHQGMGDRWGYRELLRRHGKDNHKEIIMSFQKQKWRPHSGDQFSFLFPVMKHWILCLETIPHCMGLGRRLSKGKAKGYQVIPSPRVLWDLSTWSRLSQSESHTWT